MFKRLSNVIMKPALLITAGLAVSTAWSKPPDLPVNFKDVCVPQCPCTPGQENNTIFSGNFAAEPQTQPEAENRQVRMSRRAQREAAAEQLEARLKEFLAGKTTAEFVAAALQQWMDAVGTEKESLVISNYNEYSAGRFYEIAKECEAKGDLAMARNCYEEATRMCPESAAAKLASARLNFIMVAAATNESARGGFETEEEPPQVKQEVVREEHMEPRRVLQSYTMLMLGVRYQRAGDIDTAYRCYEDAHEICPDCQYGQSALSRMTQIEAEKSRVSPNREGGVEEQEPPVDRRPPLTPDDLDQRDEAGAIFNLGERALHAGNLRMAYGFFQQTHMVYPASFFGMRAIERMNEIESRRAAPTNGGR